MAGVNRVLLIGNLGKDVEIRYTQSGTAVGSFSLAVNERRKEGDEWKDHVEWLSIVLFGKSAENASQYLKKGSTCYIEGRIQTRKWQDKEGKDRYTTEIIAGNIQYLGSKEGGGQSQKNDDYSRQGGPLPEQGGGYDPNDDIPF